MLSLFIILVQSELEHEQLSTLKLLHFLLKWKYGNGMLDNIRPENLHDCHIHLILLLHGCFVAFGYNLFILLVNGVDKSGGAMSEELLFIFPVVGLLSSPSKHVKVVATDLLVMLERLLVRVLVAPKDKPAKEVGYPSLSTPGSIVFRILQHLWFQVFSFL